jgi:hypothetical protein
MNVTPEKLAANRANAQHSTGPKTDDGKARVSQNAVKHGLTSKDIIVRPDEREEFEALQADLLAEIAPFGALEGLLFEQLLHAAWNLRRIRRLEAKAFDGAADPLEDDKLAQLLDRYARYQARYERTFHRVLKELKAVQTQRTVNFTYTYYNGQQLPVLIDSCKVIKQSQDFYEEIISLQKSDLASPNQTRPGGPFQPPPAI